MNSTFSRLKNRVSKWNHLLVSLLGAIAASGCYTSMYAFRKAFAAATFSGVEVFGLDFKICLVIAQMLGYTASKFYGIKYIAESKNTNRGKSIFKLIGLSWLALLGVALTPAPYNLFFMVANGFPLGMIWGLVFSYLEGRKTTEFMGAILSTTLIFASGFVKTVARLLMEHTGVAELWMPLCVGALFFLPLLLFVGLLELLPPPSEEDKKLRTKRVSMNSEERKSFLKYFLPGIIVTIVTYVIFTIIRDVRDNFEVEIWRGLGINNNKIFTQIDTLISLVVLCLVSFLILVRKNLRAFMLIHAMIIAGCLLILVSCILFSQNYISPVVWMTLVGTGLFMAYLPYNAVFFERLIATYHYKSNIGFVIYLADAFGYLASISILAFKEVGSADISWLLFFKQILLLGSFVGGGCAIFSMVYFKRKAMMQRKQQPSTSADIATSTQRLLLNS